MFQTSDQCIQLFPTEEQRKNGAVILHFLAAMYFFTVLAVVCDNYFLPSVELICEDLNISQVICLNFHAPNVVGN